MRHLPLKLAFLSKNCEIQVFLLDSFYTRAFCLSAVGPYHNEGQINPHPAILESFSRCTIPAIMLRRGIRNPYWLHVLGYGLLNIDFLYVRSLDRDLCLVPRARFSSTLINWIVEKKNCERQPKIHRKVKFR
jgi:hypothetical protein